MNQAARAPQQALQTPSSYTDQIAQILEQEILDGHYGRGTHLQQDEICRRFGVSRTPAREALRKLQAKSLVELVPNRGATVQLPTLQELSEVYQIRAELEGFAAELVARSHSDDLITRLDEAHQQLKRIVAAMPDATAGAQGSTTSEQLRQYNDTFHQILHHAGGNQQLSRMIQDLQRYFPKDTVRLAAQSPDALRALYLDDHAIILDEISHGRSSRARDAMRDHIHRSQELLIDFLRQRGFDD